MKTASAALNTLLNSELTTLATCMKIVLTQYQPRIVAVTKANPGVVRTRWEHGFVTGDTVKLRMVRGMTQLNRQQYQITKVDDFRFSIGVDTSAYSTYTHKGLAQKVIGFTDHPASIVFNGVTYQPTMAYSPDSVKQGADLAVDAVELRGILQNAAKVVLGGGVLDGISDEDLAAGRYSNAQFEFFLVNYADLTMGSMAIVGGRLGEATLHRGTYSVELAGKTAYLQETIQEVYTNVCRADLGDDFDGSEPEHELQQGFGCKVRLYPQTWAPSTIYTARPAGDAGLGSVIKPSSYNGRHFKCTTAGTSGLIEPGWNTAIGATTLDNGVVWTCIDALTKEGFVYQAIDRRRWIDNERSEPPLAGLGGVSTLFPITAVNQGAKRFTIAGSLAGNFPSNARFTVVGSAANDGTYTVASATNSAGSTLIVVSESIPSGNVSGSIIGRLPSLVGYFTYGLVTFLTGKNKGIAREVKAFSVTSADGVTFTGPGSFEVFEAFPFDIENGDHYEATAGCDKSLTLCKTRFDNVHNRRAEDNIPGTDSMLLYPDAK